MTTSALQWTPYTKSRYKPGTYNFNQPAGLKPLKSKYVNILLNEPADIRDTVHSVCLSIAMSAFVAGWPEAFVEKALAESPALGPAIARRGLGRLKPIIRQASINATPAAISDSVNQLRIEIAAARSQALSAKWPKTPGIPVENGTTTKVLLAILSVADAAATSTGLHLAVRRIGLESGTNKSVASRALKRLTHLRVLSSAAEPVVSEKWRANAYDLHLQAIARYVRAEAAAFDHSLAPYASHDAFRRGALGPTGFKLLASMMEGDELTAAELAATLSLSVGWVRTRLNALALYRLVSRSDHLWSRSSNGVLLERLDEAALFEGKAGESERLSAQYAAERQHYLYRTDSSGRSIDRDTGEIRRAA
jgi:hypothetical protein